MNTKKLVLIIMSVFLIASFAQAQDYIGAAKCKLCHNKETTGKQFDKWKSSPHAKAMETLASDEAKKYSADPQKDEKCLKCHSTYYAVNKDLIESITPEEGVSCESCHGPGSGYKTNAIMKDKAKSLAAGMIEPTEAVCKKCHNEKSPTFKSFNYNEFKAKFAHPNPAKTNG
jgi:hypothetical protein